MRRRAFKVPSGLQPSHDSEIENITAERCFGLAEWNRDIKALAHREAEELWLRHSNNFQQVSIHHEPARSAAAHLTLPVGVTYYCVPRRACGSFVFGNEHASLV